MRRIVKISTRGGQNRACSIWPADRRLDPVFYNRGASVVGDARNPPDRIGIENDAMRDALAFDDSLAPLAVEGETHGEYRLQRVALRASGRADVGFARRRPRGVVDKPRDRLGSNAATGEIDDRDLVSGYSDGDRGRDARLLGLVQRIVDQFLDNDDRPALHVVACQLDQLAPGGKLG
jgi:hypothetical protein